MWEYHIHGSPSTHARSEHHTLVNFTAATRTSRPPRFHTCTGFTPPISYRFQPLALGQPQATILPAASCICSQLSVGFNVYIHSHVAPVGLIISVTPYFVKISTACGVPVAVGVATGVGIGVPVSTMKDAVACATTIPPTLTYAVNVRSPAGAVVFTSTVADTVVSPITFQIAGSGIGQQVYDVIQSPISAAPPRYVSMAFTRCPGCVIGGEIDSKMGIPGIAVDVGVPKVGAGVPVLGAVGVPVGMTIIGVSVIVAVRVAILEGVTVGVNDGGSIVGVTPSRIAIRVSSTASRVACPHGSHGVGVHAEILIVHRRNIPKMVSFRISLPPLLSSYAQ